MRNVCFKDRKQAGRLLAQALEKYKDGDAIVYALPRGGVEIGAEIAEHLQAPLDLIIPRKIGHPLDPEYAICAVTESGYLVCNQEEVAALDMEWLEQVTGAQIAEARRRRLTYLAGRSPITAEGHMTIVTDDGVATGLTMLAALQEIRNYQPARIVVAVPVIPYDAVEQLQQYADEVVALDAPRMFRGYIGAYYEEFDQVEDDEVVELLERFKTQEVSHGQRSR
ncbi:MAG: phosphoribosyl transferase [Candidatus Saccharibacteria bacterium]|nr:phosphoribosyl transferase [Candidatus Saccharibacteria bacterium]